jgi:hypothetical protein
VPENETTTPAAPVPDTLTGGTLARCDVPNDWRLMVEMSRYLSKAGMWPTWFHNSPGNVMAIMMKARALDIPLDVAVHHIHVIEAYDDTGKGGRVEPDAELIRALLDRAGYHLEIVEFNADRCVIDLTPPGQQKVRRVEYTMADAVRAKLAGKTVWQKYTPDMLLARCSKRAAKLWAPGISTGLAMAGMAEDLMEGDEPIPVIVSEEVKEILQEIDEEAEQDPVQEHQRLQAIWKRAGKDLLNEPGDETGLRLGDMLMNLLKLAAQAVATPPEQASEGDNAPEGEGDAQGEAERGEQTAGDEAPGGEKPGEEPVGYAPGWTMECGCDGERVMDSGHYCQSPEQEPAAEEPAAEAAPEDQPEPAEEEKPKRRPAARKAPAHEPAKDQEPEAGE